MTDGQTNISSFSNILGYTVRLIFRYSFRTLQTVIVPRPPRMKVTLTETPPAKKARNQTRRKKRKVYLENDESLHLMKLKFEYHLNTGTLILSKKKFFRGASLKTIL